jgi:Prolyl oligopeptidase family/Dipeptidyl peptidase IV (DPP IV) N-terminal region
MRSDDIRRPAGILAGILLFPVFALAQDTPADYARAEGLRAKYEGAAGDIAGAPAVIGGTHRFWYRKTVRGAEQFIVVDADTLQKQPAFDHEKVAASLSSAAGRTYKAAQLPFNSLSFTDDGSAFTVNVEGSPYRCIVEESACRKVEEGLRGPASGPGRRRADERARVSPDGQWEAFVHNYNLAIRPSGTHTITTLSTDGSEGNYYEVASIAWSPDSQKIAVYRVRPGYRREVHYIASSPEDQLQPKHSTLVYAKPGDVLDAEQPVLFQIATRRQIVVDNALFPNAYANSELIWRKDSRAFTFEYNQRGHQVYRVIEVENIYAGPQGSFVPKSFFAYNPMMSQAELGFIVVQIDGMGTSNRSKAFHDVAWQNLGDAGFPDRILWHQAVAAKYPYYDITRVGIYGGSAGGQNALGGLLFHPDFNKAGIAYAGCHDNRMDKIWWNEQWMGWPIGPQYSASSNVDNAHRLQGDLLLVVGELDTNVDPSSTMQVVNQLIKHNKYFDLLVVPGANHPAGRGNDPTAPYGDRKRFDFFVQHLLGATPPAWNRMAAKPSTNGPQQPGGCCRCKVL